MNACFYLAFFPALWKRADIDRCNYKTSYKSLSTFHPNNLVSNLVRSLESIMLNRVQWHAKTDHWIRSEQQGFTDGSSTESICHSLVQYAFMENSFQSKQVKSVLSRMVLNSYYPCRINTSFIILRFSEQN